MCGKVRERPLTAAYFRGILRGLLKANSVPLKADTPKTMPRRTEPLTDTTIRNAKPGSKPYKLFDGAGLFVLVAPTGGKLWRLKYRLGGKEKFLALGIYPDVGLKEARRRRDEAREMVAQGIDPGERKKEAKTAAVAEQREKENTFEAVAMDWFNAYAPDLDAKHALKLRRYLEKVFFPAIGGKSVADLLPVDILDAVRSAQERGRIQTAHRLTQACRAGTPIRLHQGACQRQRGTGHHRRPATPENNQFRRHHRAKGNRPSAPGH